ncbi:hypothetical protein IE077_003638 [Cardiosporidium cionae]|uniref:Uncharacterized protein n=1 Tax=Cardiosporidium cionae TaxID=476202 RepID=A0ABQ7J7S8_9APIC|nr:hypothetical protein IE077_003638 [Cardiosporidium cionae]|eukprot:KAF8820046.1 hypothetical protein IE077_003638 [Cardiosporidium cionae]
MDSNQTQQLLEKLRERIQRCEKALGVGKAAVPASGSDILPSEGGGSPPAVPKKSGRNLIYELCRLQDSLNKLMKGSFVELEEKYKSMSSWLDHTCVSVNSLLESSVAKRAYILEHEDILVKTSISLKQVEELLPFMNCQSIGEMGAFQDRLDKVEFEGNLISEGANRLKKDVFELSHLHSTTINVIAGSLKHWDEQLTLLETKKNSCQ